MAGPPYDDQGQPALAAPVELTYPNGVRWLPSNAQVMDPKGNLIRLDATAVVLQDITEGSLMWLGCLQDWYGTGSGQTDNMRCVVTKFTKTRGIDNRFHRRTVQLMRYHQ
jgi:hypothetical protein